MQVDKPKMDEYLKNIHVTVCPLCGQNNWRVTTQVFQAPEFSYKGLLVGGASFPIIPLTCLNCGNTYFINALVAKLIDAKDPSEDSVDDKGDKIEARDESHE